MGKTFRKNIPRWLKARKVCLNPLKVGMLDFCTVDFSGEEFIVESVAIDGICLIAWLLVMTRWRIYFDGKPVRNYPFKFHEYYLMISSFDLEDTGERKTCYFPSTRTDIHPGDSRSYRLCH